MFENLGDRLQITFKKLRGQGKLTEDNIQEAMREVRMALLEADVALPVVKTFIARVQKKAIGQEVIASLTPGQAVINVVNGELIHLMGESNNQLNLAARPPVVILVAGLQGAGKTTTVAKLSLFLKQREKKKVMVTSADVYRPAAIEQLRILATQVDAVFFPSTTDSKPVDIAVNAIDAAKKNGCDVVIIDTAGRLHVDEEMMAEIKAVHAAINPLETLFVADSMTGQDAVNTSKAFDEALPLTGIILTKTDGDARGGAALSIREVTGKPIKFLGIGEKMDALEAFHPDRLASRILGMGDVMTLVEEAQQKIDHDKAAKLAHKLKKGKNFDLEDFREQLLQIEKMGGMGSMLDKLPGMGNLPSNVKAQIEGNPQSHLVAIINSMTPNERAHPAIIRASRKKRIAAGSGTSVQEINRMLKQFTQMQKMMKKMGKGKRAMQGLMQGLGGGMPGMPFR
ncbi:signal recognition particle protein [bacterium BMS3Abin11]|nr:signal recognition particle protein [bacterium BMS3Abin11]HDZ78562.1 signal recognition particle protein [Gammaproteobacteria bacterium]